MIQKTETLVDSKHFTVKKVAEGVYSAIATPGTGSLANSTIVDLGDATIVVDTLMSIQAAHDLKLVAEQLTGRPAAYVFNTHWHGDHTNGNQLFADTAQIIATSTTREIMATVVQKRIEQHLAERQAIYQAIAESEEKMNLETDAKLKKEMEWEINSDREYMKMLPDLNYTLPTLTFDEQITIHGSKRTAKLITYGGGHTQSDAFLYLPEERIAVIGDLVLSNHHPVMRYANPQEWLDILDRVEELGVETIVPGHGEVCSIQELHAVRDYITNILSLVGEIVETDRPIEDVKIPQAYQDWYFTFDFKTNLEAVRERLSKRDK